MSNTGELYEGTTEPSPSNNHSVASSADGDLAEDGGRTRPNDEGRVYRQKHHKVIIMTEDVQEAQNGRGPSPQQESSTVRRVPEAGVAADGVNAFGISDPRHRIRPDLVNQEMVTGSHPGDRFIRQSRPTGTFRRRQPGVLEASLASSEPRTSWGRAFNVIKRVLIGSPISTERSIHERLTKIKAMAVLSSDPLSSVAYATEEILRVLLLVGVGAMASLTLPIGLAIASLLAIVAISYWQTIGAYPRGGGSYTVAKENLGTLPGLTAAASLMIDYVLTVAVSVAAGIAALYSLFPDLRPFRVEICLVVLVLVVIANLRGVRESGNIFAVPTYLFIFGILGLVAYGLLRVLVGVNGQPVYTPPAEILPHGTETLSLFLILRAFTQGCTALTGVEAISNGVPAFKPPESRNAQTTLTWMALISITMFSGITVLATRLNIQPSDQETVVSQIARTVFPEMFGTNPLWFYVQIATALILVLAANTAFTDFPRLSYFVARDRFMPRQYTFRGDKLAYSWGIVTLAILASVLVIAFDGDTTALIPLYTIGVFASFTLSQSGMVVRWWRTRTPGWRRSMVINGLGALSTFVVLIISAVTKFEHGAWIVLVLIPILIGMFLAIHRHYMRVEREELLATSEMALGPQLFKHTFIVPVARLNPITVTALRYARSLSKIVTAVHIMESEGVEEAEQFKSEWDRMFPGTDISLVIIESPFRALVGPLLSYIDALDRQVQDNMVTIILPEVLPTKPWEYLLHNQNALRLKAALLFRPNTVLADMPYMLGGQRLTGALGQPRTLFAAFPWGTVFVLLAVIYFVYRFVFER